MTRLEDLGRHLRGWQLGVVAVGAALGALSLALPRPVAPTELPLPAVDRAEESAARARARELVRGAQATPLPFLVRAAGEAFRRFGAAESKGDEMEADAQQNAFAKRVEAARKLHGDTPVLALRAVQSELFVKALRERNATELHELGGKFFGESDAGAAERSGLLEDDELESLFALRWMKLAGVLESRPFSPTLNEWRLYYRTLLAHAELASDKMRTDPVARAMTLARCVEAVAKLDPDYPQKLALGITQHWMGRYDDAEALFAAHLAAHPTGVLRLRVQGYLLAARRHVAGAEAL
ncbi:MAG TPA: hypothetical protein VH062_21905 [Polyangiaceae bacterium]|jgi:hypothetical protein|nr:hypothetical protein [Polyangiaceae bacterium]